tara:strand:- start:1911 stop:3173 length:1263 start_codon:yes stop_codon:yes gene_type:complete
MGIGSKAHYLYGQQQTVGAISLVPRSKFNFTVSMTHRNPAALGGLVTTDFERIASISMPGYAKKAQTLNQYNKKRVIQTGIDYAPITMLAYDTRDGEFEKFLKQYSEYYYAGSMNYGSSFIEFNNKLAGTKLQEHKNFITTLTILRVNSRIDTNIIQIYNPMITNIDSDTLDYSDSGLVQYRITFIYEGYDIRSNDNPILTNERGFVPENIQTLPEPPPAVTNGVEDPALFEQQDDLVGTARPVDDNDVVDERTPGEKLDTAPLVGVAVDTSEVTQEEVVAELKDEETGAVTQQVVETTTVDVEGNEGKAFETRNIEQPSYTKYDQYVGQPVNQIPDNVLEEIEKSGAYGTVGDNDVLYNATTQESFIDINRRNITIEDGFVDTRKGKFVAYSEYTREYKTFDTQAEANLYIINNKPTAN